jgi:hypothetical protein
MTELRAAAGATSTGDAVRNLVVPLLEAPFVLPSALVVAPPIGASGDPLRARPREGRDIRGSLPPVPSALVEALSIGTFSELLREMEGEAVPDEKRIPALVSGTAAMFLPVRNLAGAAKDPPDGRSIGDPLPNMSKSAI